MKFGLSHFKPFFPLLFFSSKDQKFQHTNFLLMATEQSIVTQGKKNYMNISHIIGDLVTREQLADSEELFIMESKSLQALLQ